MKLRQTCSVLILTKKMAVERSLKKKVLTPKLNKSRAKVFKTLLLEPKVTQTKTEMIRPVGINILPKPVNVKPASKLVLPGEVNILPSQPGIVRPVFSHAFGQNIIYVVGPFQSVRQQLPNLTRPASKVTQVKTSTRPVGISNVRPASQVFIPGGVTIGQFQAGTVPVRQQIPNLTRPASKVTQVKTSTRPQKRIVMKKRFDCSEVPVPDPPASQGSKRPGNHDLGSNPAEKKPRYTNSAPLLLLASNHIEELNQGTP